MRPLKSPQGVILLDQALFSGTSFLVTVGVARAMDVDSYGQYAGYVLGIYLGLSALAAFVTQPFQVLQGQVPQRAAYVSFAFWSQMGGMWGLLLLAYGVAMGLRFPVPVTAWPFAAGFIMHDFGRKLLLSLDRPRPTLLLDGLAALGLLVALALFRYQGHGELATLYAYLAGAYVVSLLVLGGIVNPTTFDRETWVSAARLHLREGKWLFFTAITQWGAGNLFVVASGLYLGPAALGALRLAQSLMGVLNIVLQTFENYVLPQTARRIHDGAEPGIAYLKEISQKAGLLFLPMLGLIWLGAEPIMAWAGGAAYGAYAFVLRGLTLLYVLIFLNQPIRVLVRALLLNQHFFYGYLLSLAFALLASHGLLSSLGLTGAILGLAGSQALLLIYWTLILYRHPISLWKSFTSS